MHKQMRVQTTIVVNGRKRVKIKFPVPSYNKHPSVFILPHVNNLAKGNRLYIHVIQLPALLHLLLTDPREKRL